MVAQARWNHLRVMGLVLLQAEYLRGAALAAIPYGAVWKNLQPVPFGAFAMPNIAPAYQIQ